MKHVSGLLFLLVVGVSVSFIDARFLDVTEVTDAPLDKITATEGYLPEVGIQNEKLCGLCEEFTSLAVNYLSENRTQEDIIESLHEVCYKLRSLQQQCLVFIDHYTPQFFEEINLFNPDSFCKKVNLCDETYVASPLKPRSTCSICHQAVVEFLVQLKDPETQLEIVKALLKACNKVQDYSQQCKKLVFEYAPLMLANTEKFLEKTDICISMHACKDDEYIQAQQIEPALSES